MKNPQLGPAEQEEIDGCTRLVFPRECRLRKITYAATVTLDVTLIQRDIDGTIVSEQTVLNKPYFRLPVMIGSVACNLYRFKDREQQIPFDGLRGCFLINGIPRTIIHLGTPLYI